MLQEDGLCDARRICFERDLLALAAPAEDDRASKRFGVPQAGCLVYLYSSTDRDMAAGRVSKQGQFAGALVGSDGFFYFSVKSGKHFWFVKPVGELLHGSSAFFELDCIDQGIHYLRYRLGPWGLPRIDEVSSSRGRADIEKRWLIEPPGPIIDAARTSVLRDGEVYVVSDGATVKANQVSQPGKLHMWGMSEHGEPCGMRAALEDYGLAPVGGSDGLRFAESLFSDAVQLRAVCNEDGFCDFRSAFEGHGCEADAVTEIEFESAGKLLVIEPRGQSVGQLYYDDARRLKKQGQCSQSTCTIQLQTLRRYRQDRGRQH